MIVDDSHDARYYNSLSLSTEMIKFIIFTISHHAEDHIIFTMLRRPQLIRLRNSFY